VTLRLYDTATRSVRDFVPLTPGQVGIYLCGLTVQSTPHIGHLRSAVNYDVLRRWLLHTNYEVTFVRNVTDVDDKILDKANGQGRPFWAIAYENRLVLDATYHALNVLPPTYEPLATAHIPEMHELIVELIERGRAYPASGGNGDVYFSVPSYPEYGALSGQDPDDMRPPTDGGEPDKRDYRDFALWKGVKADEPLDASWPSPWGRGRPGWHIECSAMARRYLGDEFDIHGGGLDLTFPHHENEIAQSRSAGLGFARYWVHNGWVTLGGEKMSKSLGNTALVDEVVKRVRPVELRYYLVAPHYRSMVEYSEGALAEASAAYRRIETFVHRVQERIGAVGAQADPATIEPFAAAMDDDLGTPAALAVVHDQVRAGNTALDEGDRDGALAAAAAVREMTGILGLDPLDPHWTSGAEGATGGDHARAALGALVGDLLGQRAAARRDKDFARADAIRGQLTAAGVGIEDTPDGPIWTLKDDES